MLRSVIHMSTVSEETKAWTKPSVETVYRCCSLMSHLTKLYLVERVLECTVALFVACFFNLYLQYMKLFVCAHICVCCVCIFSVYVCRCLFSNGCPRYVYYASSHLGITIMYSFLSWSKEKLQPSLLKTVSSHHGDTPPCCITDLNKCALAPSAEGQSKDTNSLIFALVLLTYKKLKI